MNDFLKLVAFVLLFVLIFWISIQSGNKHKQEFADWAEKENLEVKKIEGCMFDNGPFWFVDEDDDVYYGEFQDKTTERKKKAYALFSTFQDMKVEYVD